jgi:hypothetical protein
MTKKVRTKDEAKVWSSLHRPFGSDVRTDGERAVWKSVESHRRQSPNK